MYEAYSEVVMVMVEGMQKLAELAATQFGLIARWQLAECLMTTHMARRRIRARRLELAGYRGVYRFPGAPRTWHSRAMELLLFCGPGSMLSHHTAAYLHGFDGFSDEPEVFDVTVPSGHLVIAPPHRVHRTRAAKLHGLRVDGLPTTSVVKALLDLADELSPNDFEKAFDSARRGNKNLEPWFTQYAEKKEARTRHSVGLIKRLFAARDGFDSGFEVAFKQELEREGFPMPAFHHTVFHGDQRIMEVDAAYVLPDRNIAVHCDGFGVHSERKQFERDALQRTQLSVLGWVQLFVTWRELRSETWKRALRLALGLPTRQR